MCTAARFDARKASAVRPRLLARLAFATFAACAAATSLARADEKEPDAAAVSAEQRGDATRLFEEGEVAFRSGDFSRAGEAFEGAFRAAPHPAPLWNAARSFERAGEIARAANAYARYLDEAPEGAPDRKAAQDALAALGKKLGLVEIYTKGASDVRLDDKPIWGDRVYVLPGRHVLEGRVDGRLLRQTEVIEAESARSMALVEPPASQELAKPPKENVEGKPQTTPKKPAPPPSFLLPALVAGGSATLIGAGLVVWSGLDTLAARRDFDAKPSQDKLESGKDKQLRTNLLLGASLGLGAATATLGSFLVVKRRAALEPNVAVSPVISPSGSIGVLAAGSF